MHRYLVDLEKKESDFLREDIDDRIDFVLWILTAFVLRVTVQVNNCLIGSEIPTSTLIIINPFQIKIPITNTRPHNHIESDVTLLNVFNEIFQALQF